MAQYFIMNGDTRVIRFERTATDVGNTYTIISILCKGGTEGYSNAGLEPFAEVIAYIIAKRIGVNTILYHLEMRNDKPFSVSKLFTTKKTGLLTANLYLVEAFPGYSFASFDIRYDFLKTCPCRQELAAHARTLIAAIGDGSLERECVEAVDGFERYEARVTPSLKFVASRCRDYIASIKE